MSCRYHFLSAEGLTQFCHGLPSSRVVDLVGSPPNYAGDHVCEGGATRRPVVRFSLGRCPAALWEGRRHRDNDIPDNFRLAGKAAIRRQTAPFAIAQLSVAGRAQVIGVAGDAVLGEVALTNNNLAATAPGSATARGLDFDAKLLCCRDNSCSERKTALFS